MHAGQDYRLLARHGPMALPGSLATICRGAQRLGLAGPRWHCADLACWTPTGQLAQEPRHPWAVAAQEEPLRGTTRSPRQRPQPAPVLAWRCPCREGL